MVYSQRTILKKVRLGYFGDGAKQWMCLMDAVYEDIIDW
jgi:hypothetical protein